MSWAKIKPLLIAVALIALAWLAWMPDWQAQSFKRSTKPFVALSVTAQQPELQYSREVMEDIRNRLAVRHEWIVDPEAPHWKIAVAVSQEQAAGAKTPVSIVAKLFYDGQLQQQWRVQGNMSAANELASRAVKLLTTAVSNVDPAFE
ncbi:hypothetical protein CWI84_11130 [Idiomarina tyrosinivorans]|uniref:Signaling protein n=1 Tax=Idiomarina tyrosinivorans TaxID=1445662 RepID=A0A432ZI01_9GAMM|nr:hypothetical protein [Idiomarina tyrosinivorans]RUO76902.1 hypothetical protein CWI84_11130 [Idiomarina tyrosinivorans]